MTTATKAAVPIVGRTPKFEPVRLTASGRVYQTNWLVSFELVATGERRYCCDKPEYGHKKRETAHKCLARTIGRLVRAEQRSARRANQ